MLSCVRTTLSRTLRASTAPLYTMAAANCDNCDCYEPVRTREPHGTFKKFDKHVVLVTDIPSAEWPRKVEMIPGLPSATAVAVKAAGIKDLKCTVATPVVGSVSPPAPNSYDVIAFPQQIRYEGVGEDDMPKILEAVDNGSTVDSLASTSLDGEYHVFVCAHALRDERCGSCGPEIASQFVKVAEKLGYDNVKVWHTSHVGGHSFAGNVLIYPGIGPDSGGEVYGYVSASSEDVETILSAHVGGDGGLDRIAAYWRGRMGVTRDDHAIMARMCELDD